MKYLVTGQFLKEMQILAKCHFQFQNKVDSTISQICHDDSIFCLRVSRIHNSALGDTCGIMNMCRCVTSNDLSTVFFLRILMIEILAWEQISNIFKVRTERLVP